MYLVVITKNFYKLLSKAVKDAFKSIFKDGTYEEILESMASVLGVSCRDLLEDPSKLTEGLRLVFGEASTVIECSILLRLSKLLGIEIDASQGFLEALVDARLKYEFEIDEEDYDLMSSIAIM